MKKAADPAALRAWRAKRQGLDGSLSGRSAAEVLERTGWARSVGGAGPYLTLFARAGAGRESVDEAASAGEICELPSARGCTYVLPAAHFALGLVCGAEFNASERKVAAKLGVTDREIEKLCAKVLDALSGAPLDPDGIKQAVGAAVRNLGEAGKKKGLTTTLPLALGELQSAGEIRRVAVNGRFDTQRYKYALWRPNPRDRVHLTREESSAELARLYWRWTGPATRAEFQWFSGLGVKAAEEAIAGLGLAEWGGGMRAFADDIEEIAGFRAPEAACYRLVSSLDGLALLRRNVRDLQADADEKLALVGGLADLPSNAILDRGTLVGLWEYDAGRGEIAWMTFEKEGRELEAEVERTERFVREELGDARTFSLDSVKSRAPRIEALRRAGSR